MNPAKDRTSREQFFESGAMDRKEKPSPAPSAVGRYSFPALALLTAMYTAGLIGLQLPALRPYFLPLVPFNLITSAAIVLLFHPQWNRSFVAFCLTALLTGYWIEVAGVQTGKIFGLYQYGPTLGYQALRVPLLIGLNWLTLSYCTGVISAHWKQRWWWQAALGASLMVLLDFFIEPVAMTFDFWSWQQQRIPLQNYVAWWIISFGVLSLFHGLNFNKQNRVAIFLYLLQLLFFILHNLLWTSHPFSP
jgi:uncharacterized membrane protein